MTQETAIAIFEEKQVRRVWYNEQWYFILEDIVFALTNTVNVKDYINKMRKRDQELQKGWGQIVHTLLVNTTGGRQKMNCVNTKGAFRIIQSIPSPKAEPFKQWLAKVGYERIQEIENPELAQERMKLIYEQKGYPKEWIERRLRGIAIRQELTDEWQSRGVSSQVDYAILTNEITKATFGMTVSEYMTYKGLDRKSNHNLRDNMTDFEVVLTMLGETTTTNLHRKRDSKKFPELQKDAHDGGNVAGNTRKDIEQQLGESVVSDNNYLHLTGKKSLKKKK
ncbi:MAG: Bro-N domain-containing protein [candidate division SR1 bacterium]|nr:Bro-N domain-containing protein [candidate division SR1 bacterium]